MSSLLRGVSMSDLPFCGNVHFVDPSPTCHLNHSLCWVVDHIFDAWLSGLPPNSPTTIYHTAHQWVLGLQGSWPRILVRDHQSHLLLSFLPIPYKTPHSPCWPKTVLSLYLEFKTTSNSAPVHYILSLSDNPIITESQNCMDLDSKSYLETSRSRPSHTCSCPESVTPPTMEI